MSPLLILVVEDDCLIRDLLREALSEGGRDEITASGEQAFALLQRDEKSKYRALLTDIHLEGTLGGWDAPSAGRSCRA